MVQAMSASHAPVLTAVAFQLSAALENYQMHVDSLKDPCLQRQQYERVSSVFDEVRMLTGALPGLSVHMVEVLILHMELMKELWLSGTPGGVGDADPHEDLRAKLRQSVSAMRERCVRVFSRE